MRAAYLVALIANGCVFAAAPSVGWSPRHGVSVGWEVGAAGLGRDVTSDGRTDAAVVPVVLFGQSLRAGPAVTYLQGGVALINPTTEDYVIETGHHPLVAIATGGVGLAARRLHPIGALSAGTILFRGSPGNCAGWFLMATVGVRWVGRLEGFVSPSLGWGFTAKHDCGS